MSKTVSVIIPVYNVKPYLSRCIESLLQQTYTSLEILLIDDGSTDGSGAICDEYAKNDPRIKVIHKPNGGVSSARNAGLRAATGDYIGFVDSDDYFSPVLYEHLVSVLENDTADISVCTFGNEESPGNFIPHFQGELRSYIFSKEQAIANLLQNKYYSCSCWDKLFRRELLNDSFFDETITHYEDLLFLYEVMKRCDKLAFFPEMLYYYCTNQGSASTSRFSDKTMTMVDVYDHIYVENRKNPVLSQVVRKEFVRNNVMFAILAANSEYSNADSIARLRANVRKEWWLYLWSKTSVGYKFCATLLLVNWKWFKKYVKRYKG